MRNSPDPIVHRERERKLIEHVERLLEDDRLRIDTTRGRRAVRSFIVNVAKNDKGVDLKRQMSDMDLPDRELQNQMPVGESITVDLSEKRWFIFSNPTGRLHVQAVSPNKELLRRQPASPLDLKSVRGVLSQMPASPKHVPATIVLLSTSGFTLEAHEAADRGAERSVILVEPNDAGGWSVYGPPEVKALVDLFDPEAEDEKRSRVREIIEADKVELLSSGLAADRIVAKTQLPVQLVENELKSYAKQNPGLAAKRLDGRVVLFREGAAPSSKPAASSGGADMPLLDRMRALFARKGETEKKIAFLAERRTALSQQRDRSYEEMSALEGREGELRDQFKAATSALSKRRITSQLLQLRKDLERRQQLLSVLNQQVTVVSTHLHNLELVQQGQSAKLPDSEEITADAERAEEMLAQLQADSELAGSVGTLAHTGLTDEEQALYEELEREAGGSNTKVELENVPSEEEIDEAVARQRAAERTPGGSQASPRRSEPEAG